MVMNPADPLQQVNVSAPYFVQPVQSQFSAGGAYAPSAQTYSNYGYTPVQAQAQSSSGGIFSGDNAVSGARQLGSIVKNNFSLPQSQTLNSIGQSLGFAQGAAAPTYLTAGAMPWQTVGAVANPSTAAGLLSAGPSNAITSGAGNIGALGTSTLSSTLGAAGIGAFAGSFLGKIGGNSTGGSIGGAIGAGIGNMIAPGIGGVIGGALGGVVGGFFGGKVGTSASEFGSKINPDGTMNNPGLGAKNAGSYEGYNKSLADEFGAVFEKAKPLLGVTKFNTTELRGGVNTKHSTSGQPGFLEVGGKVFGFNPDDNKSRQEAIGQGIAELARQNGASEEKIKEIAASLGKNSSSTAYTIPFQDKTKFTDFMNKFKGTTDVQPPSPAPAA